VEVVAERNLMTQVGLQAVEAREAINSRFNLD
jgi:hypothetical protein